MLGLQFAMEEVVFRRNVEEVRYPSTEGNEIRCRLAYRQPWYQRQKNSGASGGLRDANLTRWDSSLRTTVRSSWVGAKRVYLQDATIREYSQSP